MGQKLSPFVCEHRRDLLTITYRHSFVDFGFITFKYIRRGNPKNESSYMAQEISGIKIKISRITHAGSR